MKFKNLGGAWTFAVNERPGNGGLAEIVGAGNAGAKAKAANGSEPTEAISPAISQRIGGNNCSCPVPSPFIIQMASSFTKITRSP